MSYRLRFHPAVGADLDAIALWSLRFGGLDAAERRLAEIEGVLAGLREVPHRGSLRDAIAPGLRAVPAGRRGVMAFTVDDARREVLVVSVTWGGGDWTARAQARR